MCIYCLFYTSPGSLSKQAPNHRAFIGRSTPSHTVSFAYWSETWVLYGKPIQDPSLSIASYCNIRNYMFNGEQDLNPSPRSGK